MFNFLIKLFPRLVIIALMITSCTQQAKKQSIKSTPTDMSKGTFGYDRVFLEKHYKNTVLLENKSDKSSILVSPELQGRVMTSTLNGDNGLSFGWINHDLIASKKINDQFNAFGGEERFWLGPEGGQFALYFSEGDSFDFKNWKVPAVIDTEPFEIISKESNKIHLTKRTIVTNYSGVKFNMEINREIVLYNKEEIKKRLGIEGEAFSVVGYQSKNTVHNIGEEAWTDKSGTVSIWMLSMLNPSPRVTVAIPIVQGKEEHLGLPVNQNYFGEISKDRLKATDKTVFFKADGKSRGKIGIAPTRATKFSGSYDAVNGILTILEIESPNPANKYVNSAWEIQQDPFSGDVINSYNDGPLENGGQLGPFYELESSSPALMLKADQHYSHSQYMYHFKSAVMDLDPISKKILGVSISEIENAFN